MKPNAQVRMQHKSRILDHRVVTILGPVSDREDVEACGQLGPAAGPWHGGGGRRHGARLAVRHKAAAALAPATKTTVIYEKTFVFMHLTQPG